MKEKIGLSYLLLIIIGIIWGSQFLFNAIVIQSLSTGTVAALRITLGALALIFITQLPIVKKQSVKIHWNIPLVLQIILIAFFEAIIPFYCILWGQQYVSSAETAILISAVPFFTMLASMVINKEEKITLSHVLSIVGGFIGIYILIGPQFNMSSWKHIFAYFVILIGAFSFAMSTIMIRKLRFLPPIQLTRNILTVAAIPMLFIELLKLPYHFYIPSWQVIVSILFLGIFCSGVVYVLFVKLIHLAGANFTSLANYIVPVVGALLGVSLLNETLHANGIIALVIILVSLLLSKIKLL